ncbi:MAG: 23S rRNA (adenine(2503)-C(2))-methyltransferase RlmN [Phycisphaerales bacterium]|nr:23S rRNA (adenine(2503)-C(2))-methyltransferase RlmN [Phycisphaerales bacterium]
MIPFFSLNREGLAAWVAAHHLPRHTTDQVLDWVYRKGIADPMEMSNLAKGIRVQLAAELIFKEGRSVAHQSATDGTQKLLLSWARVLQDGGSLPVMPVIGQSPVARGEETECVLIPTDDRKTACISSQLGCPVGCRFCASGIGGLSGNLTAAQIIEQVFHVACLKGVERVSHVVFMGMGEPLANYSAVTDAIRTLNAPWGFGISARRITLSTVGLPAAILKFCDFEVPVTLALSLHAPNDALRREIIPWAEFSTINELLDACDTWFEKTGREITLEYILLGGVNDRPEHAEELAFHAKRIHANVNLIRYNEVRGMPFQRPATEDVLRFQNILRMRDVNVHIRASRGRDIAAACGQLRHEQSSPTREAPSAAP